jgi:hypothetical protein
MGKSRAIFLVGLALLVVGCSFAAGPPEDIGFRMQYQETHDWCWIAVATSINRYYHPESKETQSSIMTTVGHKINKFPPETSAFPSEEALAANPGLKALLDDPYNKSARDVLDKLIDSRYVKTGGVNDSLAVNGNLAKIVHVISLEEIKAELNAKHPIALDIKWNKGGQHCVVIAGVKDNTLVIDDPIFGQSLVPYETFPASYHGGASLVIACLTHP